MQLEQPLAPVLQRARGARSIRLDGRHPAKSITLVGRRTNVRSPTATEGVRQLTSAGEEAERGRDDRDPPDLGPGEILHDLFIVPRAVVRKWAERTNQTDQAKIAYLGQHLASVLTAVPGEGSAARGHDLIDGSEVKSCSRADQLGRCNGCDSPVPAWRPSCGRAVRPISIERPTRTGSSPSVATAELDQLLGGPRVLFILSDRTHDRERHPGPGLGGLAATSFDHGYFGLFIRDYYDEQLPGKGHPCRAGQPPPADVRLPDDEPGSDLRRAPDRGRQRRTRGSS